jgi:hypothetical protein
VDSPNLYQAFGFDGMNVTDPWGKCFTPECFSFALQGLDMAKDLWRNKGTAAGGIAKDTAIFGLGLVDMAAQGRLSGAVVGTQTFLNTEGGLAERSVTAMVAAQNQRANVLTLGFAGADDKLAHAGEVFGSSEVARGSQKIGAGLIDLDLAGIIEGGGEVVVGGSKIFTWIVGAAAPFVGGAEATAANAPRLQFNLLRQSGQAPIRNAGPQPGLGGVGLQFSEGSFSIFDWSGYPDGLPRPDPPFRLIEGADYQAARNAANVANRRMHRTDPSLRGNEIHEISPVKFGGDPVDPANKAILTRTKHSPVTVWWNKLMKALQE